MLVGGAMSSRGPRFGAHDYPQVVPEPDEIVPGGPPPWAYVTEDARRSLPVATVVARLRASGRRVEDVAAPALAELELVGDARWRPSAVLVALLDVVGEAHVILTRRSLTLRHHGGEIALPGGRRDGDEDPVATALREAHEEVGLDPGDVTPVAWLSPIATVASDSAIWPVVATVRGAPALRARTGEVDRVFTVALRDLLDDRVFLEERWRRASSLAGPGEFSPIYFFAVPGDLIWGATARVLVELLTIATGADAGSGVARGSLQ